MLKIVTCDVDGTLLKSYSDNINPKLFTLIEKLSQKGVLFVVASGRQLRNLKEIFSPVKDKIGYIAENGAIVVYQDNVIYKSKMEIEPAKKLAQKILNKDGVELFLCAESTSYVKPKNERFYTHIGGQIQNHITEVDNIDDINDDILHISMFSENGLNDELIEYFVKDFGDIFKHCLSDSLWYDFMNKNTHKGSAIEFLQNYLGITKEETASFGDNFNDIEMLRDAKYSYAMENANEEVKKVAKYVCKDVTESLEALYNDIFNE